MTTGRLLQSLSPRLHALSQPLRHPLSRPLSHPQWWGSAMLVWLMLALPAKANPEMRVAVRSSVTTVTLGSSTPATIRDAGGRSVGSLPEGRSLNAQVSGSQIQLGQWSANGFWVEPQGDGFIYIGDRWYRGRVFVTPDSGGLVAVNYVDLDQYLYSVLGGEMPSSWPLDALKAQAVAARSYALYRRESASNRLYDVGGTTTWQVYRGLIDETQSTHNAVNQTTGQVLTHSGRIIEAVFHSSSGGHTENVEDVWSRPVPYLRAVADYDAGAPVYEWREMVPMQAFSQRVTGIGNLTAAIPERITPQGRVVSMRLVGDQGSRVLSGDELRRALSLRSTLFSIKPNGSGVEITGRGFGHGVGMSQWGAHNMARQGADYRQILTHYYRGSVLAQIQVQ